MKNLKLLVVLLLAGWFLPAADAQTSSNTLVRFRFTFGQTLVGDTIFELYSQDKPITVSNFLSYVRSGKYWNTIVHYAQSSPQAYLQGGFVGVCNPYLNAEFDSGFIVKTSPPIVSETLTGPFYHNTFGTLGAVSIDDTNTPSVDPDTATSGWFVNLADNSSNFDTNNGGYCVFGHVVAGGELLNLFNTTFTNRIFTTFVDDDDLFYNLYSLPVSYNGEFYPWYSDVFVVDITEVPAVPDTTRPTVTLTTPKANSTFTNNAVTVTGAASDAGGLDRVDVYLNYDCPLRAIGTTSWSLTLTNPPPGTNLVIVQSVDRAGNRSSIAARTFFQRQGTPIALSTVGGGKIVGATDGQPLDIFRRYVLTAQPDPDYLFARWTGSVDSVSSAIAFYMQTNFNLTAVFVPNQFPKVKGVYNGLFMETNNVRPNSSGFITINVGDSVPYTGKLYMDGRSYSFANIFTVAGEGFMFIDRRPYNPDFLYLTFKVDFDNPDNPMLGSVQGSGTNEWLAGFMAYRKATNSAALAAKHTLLFPGGSDPALSPTGDGIGTVTVDALGGIKFGGTLADGTKVVQKSIVSKNGSWPLYVSLNKGKGSLIGWVQFDRTLPTTDLTGDVTWSKGPDPISRYYQAGFTNPVPLIGARYMAPVGTTGTALGFSSGTAVFSDGNLTATFANAISIGPGDRITNDSPNKMTLTLVKPTGLLKGTVTPPGSIRTLPFAGAWLQKTNIGGGFFLDTTRVGKVSATPDRP